MDFLRKSTLSKVTYIIEVISRAAFSSIGISNLDDKVVEAFKEGLNAIGICNGLNIIEAVVENGYYCSESLKKDSVNLCSPIIYKNILLTNDGNISYRRSSQFRLHRKSIKKYNIVEDGFIKDIVLKFAKLKFAKGRDTYFIGDITVKKLTINKMIIVRDKELVPFDIDEN